MQENRGKKNVFNITYSSYFVYDTKQNIILLDWEIIQNEKAL